MVRRHGWQLPAHTFQVVAITVFFLLAVSFYIFVAPFLWFRSVGFTALALYSPLAIAVFLLYIRSSAIDPADLGVFSQQLHSKYSRKPSFSKVSEGGTHEPLRASSPGLSTPSRVSSVMPYDKNLEFKTAYFEQSCISPQKKEIQVSLFALCGLLFGWIVKADDCKDGLPVQQPLAEEEVLFCTLCNAEVRRFSKHCRSCDKCVDGFDHHCRWLNNCVGRKNYTTFVFLMASSLALLVLEWGLGMAVLVRCFADKKGIEHQIVLKLGNSFSRGPFAAVVATCTLVSLLASIPLGELFFFHLILIRKGITTYEYVVAMRVQNEQQGLSVEVEALSGPASPSSSSTTALSGSSSLGFQYGRGGWCTPPRVFVDHQDEDAPHLDPGRLPSTVDPDSVVTTNRYNAFQKKSAVRISAWKLAKLNTDEVVRAAAKARASSSVLLPHKPQHFGMGYASSSITSSTSSASSGSVEHTKGRRSFCIESQIPSAESSMYVRNEDATIQHRPVLGLDQTKIRRSRRVTQFLSLNPLPAECRYGLSLSNRETYFSSSAHNERHALSFENFAPSAVKARTADHVDASSRISAEFSRACSGPAVSTDGYDASTGDCADDIATPDGIQDTFGESILSDRFASSEREGSGDSEFLGGHSTGYWPPAADTMVECRRIGNFQGYKFQRPDSSVSPAAVPDRGHPANYAADRIPSSQASIPGHDLEPNFPSTSRLLDNLVYSGTSIFYGGPIPQNPGVAEEIQQGLPLTSQPVLDGSLVRPIALPENKPPMRSVGRSQSPIFAPRAMLSSL